MEVPMRARSWVVLLVMLTASAVGAVEGVAAADSIKPVSGDLDAVSCPTASLCYAVGGTKNLTGELVKIKNSVPSKPVLVSGTVGLFAIDCPTATFCEVAGTGKNGSGAVLSVSNGKPGTVHGLNWAPQSVSCPTKSTCVIAGSSRTSATMMEAAVVARGKVRTPHMMKVKNSYQSGLLDVSCARAGACEAIGSSSTKSFRTNSLFLRIGAGASLGPYHLVKGVSLQAIACPPKSNSACDVIGRATQSVLESVKIGGTALTKISSESANIQRLSCPDLQSCTASGYNQQQVPAIVSFDHGKAGQEQDYSQLHQQYFADVARTTDTTWLAVANDGGGAGRSTVVSGTVA
jgi:hypothetical protein